MELNEGTYAGLTYYFRKFDPMHICEDDIFENLCYIDIRNLTERVRAEVLVFVGLMHTFTQFTAFTAKKKAIIYPEYRHEGMLGIRDKQYKFLSGI